MKTTILVLALSMAAGAPRAWSAPLDAAPAAAPKAEVTTVAIKLKNLTPTMLALMLAPPRDVEPDLKATSGADRLYTRADVEAILRGEVQPPTPRVTPERKPAPAGVFSLPEGVQSITPDDATRELQVRGTAEGIARVRDIAYFLDLPLRRVEMEVLSVRLNKADLKQFGAQWVGGTSPVSLGFLRGGYKETLQPLLDANRASTLLEARATMINNMASSLGSGSFDRRLPIVPSVELNLAPTINNDDTITLVMQATTRVPRAEAAQPAHKVPTVANVRDGDTIVLGVPDEDRGSPQITVTFLTPRIVRRAGEAK